MTIVFLCCMGRLRHNGVTSTRTLIMALRYRGDNALIQHISTLAVAYLSW